tara:strand:+ start:129 stop:725 length:597 start_codon:yes stop_codon:yes gene_type:complete
MKKYLIALVAGLGLIVAGCGEKAEALDVDFVSDLTVASEGWTIGVDQDGDALSISAGGVTLSTSDTTQVGIEYGMTFSGITGSASYDYTSDDEHELGFDTSVSVLGVSVDAGFDWNIDDSSFDASLGSGYSAFGLDGSVTSYWDISDFGFTSMDIDAGYTMNLTDNVSVRPNVTIPFDDDFNRGDLTAGFSVSISFGE